MKRNGLQSGFALAFTLVLMALIVIIVVAYLASTRIERSTSSVYANRLRAKMTADSGLAAAIHLLRDNTRYGNYVTAMPASSPSPAPLYTEVYRPTDSTDPSHAALADDYLRLDNAAGEILVSRAVASSFPGPEPRPTPDVVPSPLPTASPFALPSPVPALAEETLPPQVSPTPVGNSYNFNHIVRIGSSNSGRLVQPSPTASSPPALGQWVNIRNSAGELTGRYAFYIEDESMKINGNAAGNNLSAGSHLRVNDLLATLPSPRPSTQVSEIFPAGVLTTSANRSAATSQVANLGSSLNRLPSRDTISLLEQWTTDFAGSAHLLTAFSKSDETTARGWLRMDINKLVGDAADDTAKANVAKVIANWIRDSWTGPRTLDQLRDDATAQAYASSYDANDAFAHVYFDERLRLQVAANIVDYVDADSDPTDAGEVGGYRVIGIEKIPYLTEIDVVFQSSEQTATAAKIQVKFLLKFLNMYDADLALSDKIKKIRIKNIPKVTRNGITVLDKTGTVFEVPVGATGGIGQIDGTVPKGADGDSNSGAKTFDTGFMSSDIVAFTAGGNRSRFAAGMLEVEVLGHDDTRIDMIRSSLRDIEARHLNSASDFLPAGRQAASISVLWRDIADDPVSPRPLNDPRYRPSVSHFRWYNLTRTDEDRVNNLKDVAEVRSRSWAVDWNDDTGNRPLAVVANRPLLNIGELGNISVGQFPWRTLYLQYPERPPNSTIATIADEIRLMRGNTADYVLLDLFRTNSDLSCTGKLNINSQAVVTGQQGAFAAAMGEIQVGSPSLSQDSPELLSSTSSAVATLSDVATSRRIASGSPPDNSPSRPFFLAGELTADLSRKINLSDGSDTGGGRSKVTSTVFSQPKNYRRDSHVEQPFRAISDAITIRGNVFRVLFVGQSIKDQKDSSGKLGEVERASEIVAEYLGEAFVERQAKYAPDPLASPTPSPGTIVRTTDSVYHVLSTRMITE